MIRFLDMLRKDDPTSAELRAAVAELSVVEGEKTVVDLEAKRRAALLAGADDQVEKLDKEIVKANREVERVAAAIEELTIKIADAETREHAEETDSMIEQQRRSWEELRKAYLRYDEICRKDLLPVVGEINRLNSFLRESNVALGHRGLTEKKLLDPISMLSNHLGRMPGNLPDWHWFRDRLFLPYFYPLAPDKISLNELKNLPSP